MKKLIALLLLLAAGMTAFAQDDTNTTSNDEIRTLFGQGNKLKIGWFLSAEGGYTQFDKNDVALAGISGGMSFNHNFSLGLIVHGIANNPGLEFKNIVDGKDARLEGGWGGLLLEYTLFPKYPIHVTFPLIIGGGTLSYVYDDDYYVPGENEWDHDHTVLASDNFFVVEPGVKAEVNIFKFMRFGAGVSYRYTPNLSLVNTPAGFINSFTVNGSLKFGKF
jgi:hypothetical protein